MSNQERMRLVALATLTVQLIALQLAVQLRANSTGCNVTWNSTTDVLFYITPTANTSNPDCSRADTKHCVTLDEFTKHKLPIINRNTSQITLIFSKDVHNSTMPLNFVDIQDVNLCGNSHSNSTNARQTESLPLIQLLSGNITITGADELPINLEISHLAINGSGKYTLTVTSKVNFQSDNGGYISVNHVKNI